MLKNLLIVDDQTGIRMLLDEVFKKEGLSTMLASNGAEALELIEEKIPDCVLLDMKMPGLNGVEVLKRIKEKHPHIPVIMMTAYGEISLTEEAQQYGVERYFTKPFNIFEIRDAVKEAIEK